MWEAIGLVTSGLALVAFVVAAVTWVLKTRADSEARLVERASLEDLPEILKSLKTYMDGVDVSTANLSDDSTREIALAKIRAGSDRYRHKSIVVCVGAILVTVVAGLSIWLSWNPQPPIPPTKLAAELKLSVDSLTFGRKQEGAYATVRLSLANAGPVSLLINQAVLVINATSIADGSTLYTTIDLVNDEVLQRDGILPVTKLAVPLTSWGKMGRATSEVPTFRTHYFSFILQAQGTPADGSGRIWLDIEAPRPAQMTCDHDCVAVYEVKASARAGQHLECKVVPAASGFQMTCLEGEEPV